MNLKTSFSAWKLEGKKIPVSVKVLIIVVVVALFFGGIYLALDQAGYLRTFKLAMEIQQQEQLDKNVLDSLKKIILLPDGINPTMAVINDIDSLKKQQAAFFTNAKNGDRVIIYPDMAIIYDYQANKIIQVGPVRTEPPQTEQAQTGQVPAAQQGDPAKTTADTAAVTAPK